MRDPKRKSVIKEAANFYRYLRKYNRLSTLARADYNHPRLVKYEKMKQYCQLIAALKLHTRNKKGRHCRVAQKINRFIDNIMLEYIQQLSILYLPISNIDF